MGKRRPDPLQQLARALEWIGAIPRDENVEDLNRRFAELVASTETLLATYARRESTQKGRGSEQ